MFGKRERLWQTLLPLCVLASIVLGFIVLNTASTYATEEDTLYDTVPVFADGSEGELVHPVKITGGSGSKERTMYLVKLPENTTTVKFYDSSDDQNQYYNSPKQQGCANFNKTFLKKDYYNDGWWTINVSDLSFKTKTVWYNNLKTITDYYVKEAEYYELIPEAGNTKDTKAHFFIQIGDSDHPLDVYATGDGVRGDYFNEDSQIELALQLTNNRDGIINNSNQDIYYTTDNTDPTSSDTAIKYTEPFVVTKSCTVQAAAKVTDDKWGKVIQVQCVINLPLPSFSPAEGCYFGKQTISLSSYFTDADIFYSTDGTEPIPVDDDGNLVENDSIKKYESPINVDKDQTIKAVAVKKAINDFGDEVYIISAVATAKYTLSTGIDVQFNGEDQGVWLIGNTINTPMFGFENEGTIITPHGHSKCSILVSADENAILKLNDQIIERESSGENSGKFVVDLEVFEAEHTHGDDGKENVITVENGDKSTKYSIWCIGSKYDDVPDRVYDYFVPASQYTNNGLYGVAPNRTLIGKPDFVNGSSLGNFGGYITWFYEDGIKNDKKNPYGVDFIVVGNSFDGTNEAAEPGNIMVSNDGEEWYTLAGSIHYDANALWGQQVKYSNDNGFSHYEFEPENGITEGTSRFLYPDLFYYPLHGNQDIESFTTSGTFLVPEGGVNAYGNVRPPYPAFGYADVGGSTHCSNEAENPYGGIIRDGTFADRLTTNRNGDAFDLAWAVDDNGNPVQLDEIHYIKVQSASFIDDGAIGEKSTEVNVMRIAKAADSAVGVTAAPSSIKIDGTNMDLKPGEMVNANVSGVFDVAVDAPDDANVYINSLRSHTAYMDKAPHGIVRVIVQEGEKEPLIYYFKINQDADSKTVTKVTLDAGKGLLQDKEKVDCYFDEDTFEHAGKDGAIALPEATPAKDTQGFVFWQDADGNSYDAYDASLLGKAELTLQAKFAKKADAEAVKSVRKLINALPEATDVTADDIEAILEAGEAYDALTDDQKALVGDKLLQKLTDDENAIVTLVNTLIDALPAADDVTLEDAEQIETAAAAYDVLTDEGKALVTNYTKLLEAQLKLVELKLDEANAALEQEQLDNEARVKALEDTITDLTNKLTDTIAKLDKAEREDIPALQEEIADLQDKLEQTRKELAEARKALIDDSFGQLIEAAQKALDDAKAELSAAGDSIVNKALKALVDTAEKALEAAKAKADDANKAISESAKEIAALRDQVAQASQELAKAGEELAKAVASGVASEKEISELKNKVAEAQAAKDAAEKAAAEAAQGKQTSDDELAKTKAALAEAEAALANLKAEIAASELKVAGLKVKSKSKKFTVTWKKNASADGYKVQYRLKGKKYKTLKEVTKLKAISKKLKKGKKYQFRVATYKTVNGKKIYGKWSKVKTVKCK